MPTLISVCRTAILLIVLSALVPATLLADITISDPFPGFICQSPTGCDVIAGGASDARYFDIQKAVVGSNSISLYFDYGTGWNLTELKPFKDSGLYLNAGDLFIGGYAIPLYDHFNTLNRSYARSAPAGWTDAKRGKVYSVTSTANAYETLTLLNDPPLDVTPGVDWIYRYYNTVWMKQGSATGNSVTVQVKKQPGARDSPVTTAKYVATISKIPDFVMNEFSSHGLYWSSTTCANDVISQIPEPTGYVVLLGGLAGIVFMVRRTRQA